MNVLRYLLPYLLWWRDDEGLPPLRLVCIRERMDFAVGVVEEQSGCGL